MQTHAIKHLPLTLHAQLVAIERGLLARVAFNHRLPVVLSVIPQTLATMFMHVRVAAEAFQARFVNVNAAVGDCEVALCEALDVRTQTLLSVSKEEHEAM